MSLRNRKSSTELALLSSRAALVEAAVMVDRQATDITAVEHTAGAVAGLASGLIATDQTLVERTTELTDNSPYLSPAEARGGAAPYLESARGALRSLQVHGNAQLLSELLQYERRSGR
jgi:hypothetical protein